ncbi:MAG TPA: PIN domain-containing protein [Sporichthyaceae bacterium]|nr:PIN domain-containing protein [Sporichthyaceae bacterium]
MIVVLDSTVLIDYLRGRPAVAKVGALLGSGDEPATTAINVEEIVRGLRATELPAADALFAGLYILPITTGMARTAGTWRREFAAQGITPAQADCLIAAATIDSGGRLATGNPKHFPMDGLTVEHWPVGG